MAGVLFFSLVFTLVAAILIGTIGDELYSFWRKLIDLLYASPMERELIRVYKSRS